MTDSVRKPGWYVSYRVEGFVGPGKNGTHEAGPYPTEDEADRQSVDIKGFEDISHVWVFEDPRPKSQSSSTGDAP